MVASKQQTATKPFSMDMFDSDSDLSDTERLILERRRLNTEYMEQIEKERQERAPKYTEKDKERVDEVSPEKTNRESEDKTKDVMDKTLEELEAERDALLQAVRNPEPPALMKVDEKVEKMAMEVHHELSKGKSYVDSDEENLEARRARKKRKEVEVNGDVELSKRLSESSTGESSPCGQVSQIYLSVFFVIGNTSYIF